MEHSKPEPDNVPNGASHRAEEPANADVSLGEDHRWLRALVENSSDIVMIFEADATIRYASPTVERVLGYRPEDIVGTVALDYVHPDDLPRVLEETEEALSKGGVVTNRAEYRFRHRDGLWRWMESVGTYLLDDPHVGSVVVTSRDVTERKEAEEALRESEQRFKNSFRDAAIGMALVGTDGRWLRVNRSLCQIVGYQEEELLGKTFQEITHPDDLESDVEQVRQMLAGEIETYQMEKRYLHKNGHVVWVLLSVSLVHDEEGEPLYFISQIQDIAERKRSEGLVRQQAALLEQTHDAVFMWKLGGGITYWNQGAERLYGWSKEEALGHASHELLKTIHPFAPEELVHRLRRDGHWEGELVHHARDGRRVIVESRHVLMHHDSEPGFVMETNRDVTERKALGERLHYQAHHDLLTDLPNRQLFLDRLEQALRRTRRRPGSKVALLFVDLDNFKVVNDSLGHEVGDLLLVRMGERLRRCLRPEDILARFGGDEFAMLLENVENPEDAVRVAERIIEELRTPFMLEGKELVLRASVGIAMGHDRSKTPEELLKDADTAMYRAKEDGVGYRMFEQKMYEQALRRLKLENDMRRAIEVEEFVVNYQPIVNLQTGVVWGNEALVRWEHPERGLLDPFQFVPVAEETGLIVPIGERVLEEACYQAVEWQQERPEDTPLVMCVNLSAKQLRRQDLADTVIGILHRTGLDGCCLCLDITETLYITVLEGNTAALDDLKRMGVRISVDDFGMGYSSLSYLKRLPAETLKIDRSFVAGVGENTEDTAIVRMTIELAHTFGMEIIAEGVESEAQAEQLKEMGCDRGQGYYFAEPLPPEEVTRFLSR